MTQREGGATFYVAPLDYYQPQELQEPQLLPLLRGFSEVMPKPERGPSSTKSTVIFPVVSNRVLSTRNFRVSLSKTESLSFGSSRANPKEGPLQPPCIKAMRRAESMLFSARYSFSLVTARSVTCSSAMSFLQINELLTDLQEKIFHSIYNRAFF